MGMSLTAFHCTGVPLPLFRVLYLSVSVWSVLQNVIVFLVTTLQFQM
jgi:hypothetical protein